MLVARDATGRIVPLLDAKDSTGQTLREALACCTEEEKRQARVDLRLHYGLPADPLDAQPIN